MLSRAQCIIRSCLLGSVIFLAACTTKTIREEPSLFPDNLSGAAFKTYAVHMRAINAGKEKSSMEIPAQYWAQRIKGLKPIKVYTHRANIVVVQRISDNTEEGKYIYIPISSYHPMTGDDGFTFTPIGNGIFNFKRTL